MNNEIVSINFKNVIIRSQIPFEYEFSNDVKTKTIPKNYMNDYYGNFRFVKKLIIESICLFAYLLFSNLPNLQSFKTGDESFSQTTSLSLSSMIIP